MTSKTRAALTPTERNIYRELIDLASFSARPGWVCDQLNIGYTRSALIKMLQTSPAPLQKCIDKLSKPPLEDIKIHPDGSIEILNFFYYQPKQRDRSKYWAWRYAQNAPGAHQALKKERTRCAPPLDRDRDREGDIDAPPKVHTTSFNKRIVEKPEDRFEYFSMWYLYCWPNSRGASKLVEDKALELFKKHGWAKLREKMEWVSGMNWSWGTAVKELEGKKEYTNRKRTCDLCDGAHTTSQHTSEES